MGSFANLTASLNLNIQNFSRQLKAASTQANSFAANLNGKSLRAMMSLNAQTKAWGFNMKSVARVVSGIVISQAFYKILQSVQQATGAVWEFTKQLEYAQIAYSNLFGDTALAQEFINVLKDFAALTPFGFTEAEQAAKRLLAYGIEYKNVMYVMNGVLTASAAQGDSRKIEQISRALGQIYTYGKLMTAEVRQLTEAGIPVYDILQEKLGLTQAQLRNLGNEAIPASDAINALVDGINERFGNVLEASSKTMQGIISNIKDNATMLFAGIFEPFTVMAKSVLYEVGQFLFNMRELFETAGTGGVFEAIFPPETHAILRQFVANVKASLQAVIQFALVLGNLLKPVLLALIQVYNAFSPVLTAVRSILYSMIYVITSNAKVVKVLAGMLAVAAAMWVMFKVKAIATAVVTAVITGIAKALAGLAAMLTFVVAHPFWALLIGLTGVIVGLSGGFTKLGEKINNFFKSLTKFNGVDPDKVLLPSQKDRANDLDKFNNKLEGTSDAMDDLADSTGKATKAAKGLLSFDEVFKLNEPDEGTGSGIGLGGFEDLEDMLGGLGGDAFVPDIPDFSEYMKNFKETFANKFREMWNNVKDNIITAALGAGLGAAIGGLIGGPAGAKIGAAIGALAGWFWSDLADKLGLTTHVKIATPIGALLGTAIGALVGHPIIGAAIGGLVGFLFSTLLDGIREGNPGKIGVPLGTFLGAAIGYVAGGPAGAAIGAAIGALVGWLGKMLAEGIAEHDVVKISTPIGTLLGAAIGLVVGGPAGAAIGAAVGAVVTFIISKFATADWSKMKEAITAPFKEWASFWGEFFSRLWKRIKESFDSGNWLQIGADILMGIIAGLIGAAGAIVTAIGTVFWSIWNAFCEAFGIHSPAEEMKPIGKFILHGILQGMLDTVADILKGIVGIGEQVTASISGWLDGIGLMVTEWVIGVVGSITNFFDQTGLGFINWITGTKENFTQWKEDTITTFSNWKTNTANTISTWKTNAETSISNWKTNTSNTITTWKTDAETTFTNWKDNVFETISNWKTDAETSFSNWKQNTSDTVLTWKTNAETAFTTWKNNTSNTVSTWKTNAETTFTNWKANVSKTISTWKTDVENLFKTWWTSIKAIFDAFKGISFEGWAATQLNILSTWASNVWSTVKDKIGKAIDKIKEFFGLQGSGVDINVTGGGSVNTGHATGGIFDREHIARFAEGNKAEAVIPLENASAMQPFVDAISRGIIEGIAPSLLSLGSNANTGNSSNLPPMYVGTLIADERGLKQLYKKLEVIQVQENARRGLA